MIPWDKLHGAMTHFPIALLLFSTACDFVSVMLKRLPFARELRSVSLYALAQIPKLGNRPRSRLGFCAEKRADLLGNYFARILEDDDDFSTSEFRFSCCRPGFYGRSDLRHCS